MSVTMPTENAAAIESGFRFIRVERDAAVLTITIDRPEVLNSLHRDAHVELSRAFDRYAEDPELRVAIITGTGDRAFCVGTDLKSLARTGEYDYPSGGFAGITKRFDLWKPVIAAVNGLCLGGGVEILAACDLAVAAEHAEFGLPEPRVGQAALGGGALQRLARQMPMKDAMWLALTGNRISAADARRVSLVNEVVPRGMAQERARAIARDMLDCAPLALEASKQVLLQSTAEPDLAAAMRRKYPAAERMLASEDALEGPRAFAEKRKPHWRAR
jgi:crotonobetainyl-CoA hydratase